MNAPTARGAADSEAMAVLRDGLVLFANAAFLRLCGEDGPGLWEQVIRDGETRAAVAAGRPIHGRTVELSSAEGPALRRRISVEPLHSGAGGCAVLVRVSDGAADASVDDLRRAARRVAHDLNNALGALLVNAQLALELVGETSPAHADLVEARRAGEVAAALTGQLQALVRGEAD